MLVLHLLSVLLLLLPQKNFDSIWIIDLNTSDHMTSKKSNLSSYKNFDCLHKVILGNNSEMYTEGERKLHCYFGLSADNDRVSNYAVILNNVLLQNWAKVYFQSERLSGHVCHKW